MAYEKLFEKGRIGGLTIRNRAVMSPMGTDMADTNGNASQRLIAYYGERAKGGIGLIINEYTGVDDVDSIPTQHNLRMAQDYNVKAAEELTRTVHRYGAKIFAQLHHGGATSKSAFTGRQNLSPSGFRGSHFICQFAKVGSQQRRSQHDATGFQCGELTSFLKHGV